MALPDFDENGDLPVGVHQTSLAEVVGRFGTGAPRRETVTQSLRRIHELATETGKLDTYLIFDSYVTAKAEPNDVDVVLIMQDDFRPHDCAGLARKLFDHQEASRELGASVFWVRPSMLLFDTLDAFKKKWQLKRDGSQRGIVEVRP